MIRYQRAVAADVPQLVDLIHVCFAELATLTPPSGAIAETPAAIAALLARGVLVKAVMDGALVGCVAAEPCGDHVYVGRLAVLPARRRLGIAQGLLAEVEDYAREIGAAALTLNVRLVLPANIRLFERVGYRITGQGSHPGFAIPTYHVMEKRLV